LIGYSLFTDSGGKGRGGCITCDSVRVEMLLNVVTGFVVPVNLVSLIQMLLSGTCAFMGFVKSVEGKAMYVSLL
jgi:hypothetical protein